MEPTYGTIENQIVNQDIEDNLPNAQNYPTESESCWNGRNIICCSAGISLCTGGVLGITALLAFISKVTEISIPTILIGPIGAVAAPIYCIIGCCLWKSTREKFEYDRRIEELITKAYELGKPISYLTNQISNGDKIFDIFYEPISNINEDIKDSTTDLDSSINKCEKIKQEFIEVQSKQNEREKRITSLVKNCVETALNTNNLKDQSFDLDEVHERMRLRALANAENEIYLG